MEPTAEKSNFDLVKSNIGIDMPEIVPLDMNYLDSLPMDMIEEKPKKKKKLTKAEKKELKLKEALAFKELEIRDQLRRELELSKRGQRLGLETWEQMCAEVRVQEFREEMVEWKTKAQRWLEKKDEKIQMLLEDMCDSEELQKLGNAKHVEIMDSLLDLLAEIYLALKESSLLMYERCAKEAIIGFYEELTAKLEVEADFKTNCENAMLATSIITEHMLFCDYYKFLHRRNDAADTEIERRYVARDKVCKKMKISQRQLQTFVKQLSNTALDVHKFQRISRLMQKQSVFVAESKRLNNLELKLTRLFGDLQRDLLITEIESSRKLNDLRLEHAYFMGLHKTIEVDIKQYLENTFANLTVMSNESYVVIKKFKRLEKYGELLLSLAAMCRKLETESEKVVPWGTLPMPMDGKVGELYEEKELNMQVVNLQNLIDLPEKDLMEQMRGMRNFWRRVALAKTQILLLDGEKNRLLEEKDRCIKFIKSFSKSEDVEELKESVSVKCLIEPKQTECTLSVLREYYN